MASTPPVLIRFTPEEVAALFEQAAPAAKLDFQELLPQYSKDQQTVALDVARRSLVARDVLQFDRDARPALHPVAQAAVAALVRDEPSVVIFRQPAGAEPSSVEYHTFGNQVYLAHMLRRDEVHEFAVFEDAASFSQAILDGLGLANAGQLSCPPGQVAEASLSRTIEMAQAGGDRDKVQAALSGPSLPKKTAEQLAATLAGPYEFKTVVLPEAGGESAPAGKVLSFLQGQNGLWLVEGFSGGQANGPVTVQPMSDSAAREAVQKLIR